MAACRGFVSPDQRVDLNQYPQDLILLLDNYDSFTYNLVDYFSQLGIECDVVRNDILLSDITNKEYQGVVLSPGPEVPSRSGVLMEVLEYYEEKLPILGICLGHQAIGQYFGAKLVKAEKPMHGKLSSINCENHALYQNIGKKHGVVRYNSWTITDVISPLEVLAETDDGEIMAIAHNDLPIWGIQYHPEAALSQEGLKTLNNWVEATL